MARGKIKKELILPLPEHCFWVNQGPIVSNLQELYSVLQGEITPDQFSYHVTSTRNDFADWIEYTLQDKVCAKAVRKVKKQKTLTDKVKICLKDYKD